MKKYSQEFINLVIQRYKENKNPYWLIKNDPYFYGVNPGSLYDILSRNGIRKFYKDNEKRKNNRKYNVNDRYFKDIDTGEKAYWLGLLMADGNIGNTNKDIIALSLSVEDKIHLEKFKSALQAENPIKNIEAQTEYGYAEYCRISISSKEMKNDLKNHGLIENKSLILQYPNIDNSLHNHFIRGYFDGDGCITYTTKSNGHMEFRFSLCGTYEFLTSSLNILGFKKARLYRRFIDRENNNYCVDIGGNKQVYNILKFLYKDATVFLDRKYKRYLMLELQNNSRF